MQCILLLCLVAAFAPLALGSLIVGGKESVPHSRPYQVALYDSNKPNSFQFCGGTLVDKRWVVSAAHCAGGTVYVGLGYHHKYEHDKDGQQYIKGTWHVHNKYNGNTIDYDISLIELSEDAVSGEKIAPIGIGMTRPTPGEMLLVSGWGTTSSGAWTTPKKLREVEVAASTSSACNSAYSGITENMFCAASPGKDACQGDSGGPIVSGYGDGVHNPGTQLRGIVSWGAGCASPGYPGVYTNIANVCDWIQQTSKGAVSCN